MTAGAGIAHSERMLSKMAELS
ncbi:hypothetical protein [Neorhizobium petrolearium]